MAPRPPQFDVPLSVSQDSLDMPVSIAAPGCRVCLLVLSLALSPHTTSQPVTPMSTGDSARAAHGFQSQRSDGTQQELNMHTSCERFE